MSLANCDLVNQKLKEDLALAREQLFAALDRYAGLCSTIRSTHHQTPLLTAQYAGYPASELNSEILVLPLLEERLGEAVHNLNRAYELGQARRSPAYPPPIDKLPDEILTQVFGLVVATEPRDLYLAGKYSAVGFPSYPDFLAQTCVRWHQIALACSSLWTHIYLDSHPARFSSILDRAWSYAQRAGDLPLELHITGSEGRSGDGLKQFLSSVAHRTASLEIFRSGPFTSQTETQALASILRGCSDTFTRLAVRSHGLPGPGFIESVDLRDREWGPGPVEVDLSVEQIERGFLHLTALHASQIYPQWTSTAYQGLVDLRLISKHKRLYEWPHLNPVELIAILSASPRLRVLHFGVGVDFDPDSPAENISVQLNDLEVLSLSPSRVFGPEDTEYQIQRILHYITPGSKPLNLTLDIAGYHDPDSLATTKEFFSRSHIVRFCAKRGGPPPVTLLDCAPQLTELVFDRCVYDTLYDFDQVRSQGISLSSWVIRDSTMYMEDLELHLKQYPVESVIMSNCRLFRKSGGPVEVPESDFKEWGFDLPDHVQYLKTDQPPGSADWYNLE